jgi:lipopolysaccharide export system permease protein
VVVVELVLAMLVYFVFMNLQRAASTWMEDGVTPAWLGIWWVPALMTVLAVLLLLTDSLRFDAWRRRLVRRLVG